MALRLLLASLSLFSLVNQSAATPVSDNAIPALFKKADTHDLDELHDKWKGVYFTDAQATCSSEQFDTLLKTLDQTQKLLNGPGSDDLKSTPGWNRFFVADENVGPNGGWAVDAHYDDYQNVIANFEQAQNFLVKGNAKKLKKTPANRITFTCHPPRRFFSRCAEKGAGAFRLKGDYAEKDGYGDLVVLCPKWFEDKYQDLDKLVGGKKKKVNDLPQLYTKAVALAHEMFHCERALQTRFFITDLETTLPGVGHAKVYGPDRAARLAWMNTETTFKKNRKVNTDTTRNADNYAWTLAFNYFNDAWGWKDDGKYTFPHDEVKRSMKRDTKNSTSIGDPDFEQDPDSVLEASKIDKNKKYPQKNCAQVGKDRLDVKCEYIDEDYNDWVKHHPHPSVSKSAYHSPTPTPTKSSSPPASKTGSATCEVIFINTLSDHPDYMYKVIVKGDWAKEDKLKSEIQTCVSDPKDVTAWIWEKHGDDGSMMAAFDLDGFKDKDCAGKAIQRASKDAVKNVSCPFHKDADKDLETRLMKAGASG